jgi:hypothetical protein
MKWMEEGGREENAPLNLCEYAVSTLWPAYPKQPTERPRRGPKPDRRRALELLASSPDGCSEAIMLARGFTVEQIAELVHAGLATTNAERVAMDARTIEVARVRITEAGRGTLRKQ